MAEKKEKDEKTTDGGGFSAKQKTELCKLIRAEIAAERVERAAMPIKGRGRQGYKQ